MKTTKRMLLTGTAIFALANSVSPLQAQQLLSYYDAPHSGMMPGYHYQLPPPTGKVYLGFDIGAALQQDITIKDTFGESEKVNFDPGVRFDFQAGYNFTTDWAAEMELGVVVNQVKDSVVFGTDFMEVDLVELPIMVNVIYTQPLGRGFSACIGGGIGGVFSDYSNEYGGTTKSDATLAFQGIAGLKYTINERWDTGVSYKFLGTTEHDIGSGVALFDHASPTEYTSGGTMTHSILIALTCRF
jgi:opacity protein-like surface antigen